MNKGRNLLPFVLLYFAALAVITAVNAHIRFNAIRPLDIPVERQITADGIILDLRYDENDTMWLRKISPDGKLLGHIPLSTRAQDDSPISYDILAASGDKVYLHTYTRLYDSSERRDMQIMACDLSTGKRGVLYRPQSRTDAELIDSWAETSADGGLYFGHEYRKGSLGLRLKIFRMDMELGSISEWMDVPLPFILNRFIVTNQGKLFAASPDSSVYQYDNGEWTQVFKAADGWSAAQVLPGSDALYLFLTNYNKPGVNRLLRLAPDAGAFELIQRDMTDCVNLSVFDSDTRMTLTENYAYEVWHDGGKYRFSALQVPFHMLWDLKLLWYMLPEALLTLLLVATIRHLYLRRKTGLIVKLLAVSVPIFALGAIVLIQIPSRNIRNAVEETAPIILLSEAAELAEDIDARRFANINWSAPWSDSYYRELREQLENRSGIRTFRWWGSPSRQIVEDTIENNTKRKSAEQESRLYTNYWMYRVDGRGVFSAICGRWFINVDIAHLNSISHSDEIDRLLDLGQPVFVRFYDDEFWLALLYPVFDEQEQIVGILEVSRQTRSIKRTADSITRDVLLFSVSVFTAMLLSYALVMEASLRNLNKLKRGALALSEGDYSIRVPVKSRDEIGDIASAFNGMADSVRLHMDSIKAVGDGYGRFVPDEMLSMLHRDSITCIKPRDYASLRAMFMTLTTESFDAYRDKEYIDAMNRFYTCILPILSGGGGLVERFTAKELRALFDCTPLAALNTALEMFSSLNRLNEGLENTGHKPVKCGVLLALSQSFLGVAGYDKRLNIILQSPYSYKVESIRATGLRYGCRLLLEQGAFEGLGADASRYRHRLLGYILDGGERRALYDFYDSELVEQACCRDSTRESFEEAVRLYYSAQYGKARSAFIDVIQRTPEDLAAREYLKKSHLRFGSDMPPDNLFEV